MNSQQQHNALKVIDKIYEWSTKLSRGGCCGRVYFETSYEMCVSSSFLDSIAMPGELLKNMQN